MDIHKYIRSQGTNSFELINILTEDIVTVGTRGDNRMILELVAIGKSYGEYN